MENRGRVLPGGAVISPESAKASALFEQFVSAGTFKSVLATYRQICEVLRLKPTNITSFFPRLKAKLHSWKAASLWAKLDKRASHKCYNRGKACPNTRVLIIGAGPCGLRAAIEAQLLGAKVVVVEKRDRFSRNNVLHLWPFVIHDLRNLGSKKFFGKFCAGSIDHISIRQLQLILLKVALLLGVEVHANVGFVSLKEPSEDQAHGRIGWQATVSPADHPVAQYEFDVLIGADGKRNTLSGFNRKEFRGKLAIAVTANFINRHTLEEARVEEISGVAFIFNQKFFQDMREETGINLENIVYYKDDTHYFVMTAKKQSLLDRGVIINDYNDTARLLSVENVDRGALMEYARDAASFATEYQLPHVEFAVNHYGQADVAMFDFTSMYAAENACRIKERRGYKLLQTLVGDSLLEPFWPTGSGCARGFLSSLDVGWMIKSWASGKLTPLQVLAEREAIYRLLAQTTPENLSKDLNQYTLNPTSRYPNLNLHSVLPSQVRSLYDTDAKLEDNIIDVPVEIPKKKRKRDLIVHPDALLNWCQRQVATQDIKIENLTSSWKSGLALCSILNRYRPDLINVASLNSEDVAKNNQLAFDICEKELGIPPVMTGQEMADCEVPDKLSMVSYLAQIYDAFRGEIPVVCQPKSSNDDQAVSPNRQPIGTTRSIFNRIGNKFQNKRKYSVEKESAKEKADSLKRGRHSQFLHKRRSKDKDKGLLLDSVGGDITLTNFKILPPSDSPRESINSRVKSLEMKMRKDAGLRCHLIQEVGVLKTPVHGELNIKQIQEQLQKNGSGHKEKPILIKVGQLKKDEWNVKMWEDKIKQQEAILQKSTSCEKNKIKQEIFNSKLRLIDAKLQAGGALTAEEKARFAKFDSNLGKLQEQLTKGNLDVGERGHNQVAAMTEHMTTIWDKRANLKRDPLPPPPAVSTAMSQTDSSKVGSSSICYFCKHRVYVMEQLSAEGLFFHRSCFKCEYCSALLRLGNYAFDNDTACGGKFYCTAHFRMKKPDHRWQEMMKRKQAFLSHSVDEQEREKMYTTLLANTEKALSPNQQEVEPEVEQLTVTDSLATPKTEELKQENVKTLLLEPLNLFGRDQTPERVEYENSTLDYSEEELLTGELEEEELREKNFGPIQDLATSDDAFSDFSDSESDEEAYAEELERSLTADETRKLAERWQRKYSAEHSLMDSAGSSSDEASDTEIGSEDGTSDDINSDDEYSIGNSNEEPSPGSDVNPDSVSKTPDLVKGDLTVEVPVIDLKGMNHDLEEETSEDEDDVSDSNNSLESESSSEEDSESKPQADLPPPLIPVIVIEDVDQDWAGNSESEANAATEHKSADIISEETNVELSHPEMNVVLSVSATPDEVETNCDKMSTTDNTEKTVDSIPAAAADDDAVVIDTSNGALIKSTESYLSKSTAIIEQTIPKCDVVVIDDLSNYKLLKSDNSSEENGECQQNVVTVDDNDVVVVGSNQPSFLDCACDVVHPTSIGAVEDTVSFNSPEDSVDKDEKAANIENLLQDEIEALPSSQTNVNNDSISDAEVSPIPDLDLRFVTIRKKDNKTSQNHDSFTWDSDNSVSLPWFCNESQDFDIDLAIPNDISNEKLSNSKEASEPQVKEPSLMLDNTPKGNFNSTPRDNSFTTPQETSEYFTPFVPKVNSTPLSQTGEKFQTACIMSTSDLLSPISENESKVFVSEDVESHEHGNKTKPTTTNVNSNSAFTPINFTNSKQDTLYYSDMNSNHTLPSTDKTKDFNAHDSSKSKKVSGYSGSFAEKIRPKSALGDTIYLRSLNINLQNQKFMTITKSNDKLDEVSSDNCDVRKKLFHGSDKSLSQPKPALNDLYLKSFKRQTSVPSDSSDTQVSFTTPIPKTPLVKGSTPQTKKEADSGSKVRHFTPPILFQESYGDPVSPYTYAQSRPNMENSFPVKMQPKCGMDLNKLKEKREKRKSVHENIVGLPFADEEKASTPVDPPTSPGNVFRDFENSHGEVDDEDSMNRSNQSDAQEKARKEARARARLKSDEELGLSPKNYRKKYQRQPSFSSIYYDELNSDEFYDHENEELADDVSSLRVRTQYAIEAQGESSDIDQPNSENCSIKSVESVVSNHSVKTLEKSNSKQDFGTSSLTTIEQFEPKLEVSPLPLMKTSSSETSPEIFLYETYPEDKNKQVTTSVETLEEEKTKNKKSFFSILNFGKGHVSKDKTSKNKVKDTDRASSLPADLGDKAAPKQKTLVNLKLSKGKDKFKEKRRQKHFSTGTHDGVVIENAFIESVEPKVPEEPKNLLFGSSQAQVVPKYEVYRNPGVRLSAIPNHVVSSHKTENGLAPKASEDSFSDTEDDTQRSNMQAKASDGGCKEKDTSEKEKKVQRVVMKVHRQQELKRLRNAQEIQRRLEEVEVQQKELEQRGVEIEKIWRAEGKGLHSGKESDLMNEWYKLIQSKNQLIREEQELLIRLKDLELEERHSRLQQEITERMAESTLTKHPSQISEEKKILTEMLRIVEERDELVAMLDQLRLKEEEDEKSFKPQILTNITTMPCSSKVDKTS